MYPPLSEKATSLLEALKEFIENDCIPAEPIFHSQIKHGEERWKSYPPIMEDLKKKAKSLGLWNLFLSKEYPEGAGLTNLEYAYMSELMGRSIRIAPEACNCSAPDTGNMEVLSKYGNEDQKKQWLVPLLEGKIRSAFAMTEPDVASSDATNVETIIKRDGNDYVINGRKWYITGGADPRCKVYLVLGKTDPNNKLKHKQQSVIIVPRDTPGITVVRPLGVFGYDDAPSGHCELIFKNVRVPASNMVLGEGRGFEVIQGRLGPGRIHHCMRALGAAERSLELLLMRSHARSTFGKKLVEHGLVQTEIAESRIELEKCRLLVLNAAYQIDKVGAKKAWREIAIAKVAVPNACLKIMDKAIQIHGAAGVSQDTPLAELYASLRTLRIADGPDAVHQMQIARNEIKQVPTLNAKYDKYHARTLELNQALKQSKL